MAKTRSMRIIAGQWRSRVINHPDGKQTRPMPDRVREAVFGILGSLLNSPGGMPSVTVADVFAGSGSMGLEALSRGAEFGYFFEKHPVTLKTLKQNIESLEAAPQSRILTVDAWRDGFRSVPDDSTVQVIFLDPPYRDSVDSGESGKVCQWLKAVAESKKIADSGLCILHYERRIEYGPEIGGDNWHLVDHRQYGTNHVSFYKLNSLRDTGVTGQIVE